MEFVNKEEHMAEDWLVHNKKPVPGVVYFMEVLDEEYAEEFLKAKEEEERLENIAKEEKKKLKNKKRSINTDMLNFLKILKWINFENLNLLQP